LSTTYLALQRVGGVLFRLPPAIPENGSSLLFRPAQIALSKIRRKSIHSTPRHRVRIRQNVIGKDQKGPDASKSSVWLFAMDQRIVTHILTCHGGSYPSV